MKFQGLIIVLLVFTILFLLAKNTHIISDMGDDILFAPKNIITSFDTWLNRKTGFFPN